MGWKIDWPVFLRICILTLILPSLALVPTIPARAATYTVNSLADPGSGGCTAVECTLREAITAANANAGADTITFSVSGVITLGSDLPRATAAGGALTIDGSGQNVDISGANTHRVFWVASNARLTLVNLEVKNGYSGVAGGGVYNQGYLTIRDSQLLNNVAEDQGGAIYTTGVMTLTNTSLSNNTVNLGNGGAIYIDKGKVFIYGGTFQSNHATVSGGAIYNDYFAEYQGGELTVRGTKFLQNRAGGADGGAITNRSILQIDQATFGLNSAEENGGALSLMNDFMVTGSVFTLNSVDFLNGGAVYVYAGAATQGGEFIDCTFSHNLAGGNGGAIYNQRGRVSVERSRINDNTAHGNGGGLYNWEGMLRLDDSSVEDNQADGNGGGFYDNDNAKFEHSTFWDNHAGGNGGGLYRSASGDMSTLSNNTFYANSASQGGGAYIATNAAIENCTFSGNSANAGGGGALYGNYLVYVRNSILANSPSGGNCALAPTNDGNNIDSGATCNFAMSGKGSLSNTNPLLLALADNGGPTKTMALQAASPAVDGVTWNAPNNCPADDQRGLARPYGARCDIGAFERYWSSFLPFVRK